MFYYLECGLSQWMFYVNLKEMCILLLLHEAFCKCQLNQVDWWYCLIQLHFYWFSAWWFCQLLIEMCWSLNYNDGLISFSFQFYLILPHVFWWCILRHIHVKDYHVFLENWPRYHYVTLMFLTDNFLCFEVCFLWNNKKFCLNSVTMVYFPLSL